MNSLQLLVLREELTEQLAIKKMRFNEMVLQYLNNEIQINPIEFKYKLNEYYEDLESLQKNADEVLYKFLKSINCDQISEIFNIEEKKETVSNVENEKNDKVNEEEFKQQREKNIEGKLATIMELRKKAVSNRIVLDPYVRNVEKYYHNNNGKIYKNNAVDNTTYIRYRGYTYRRRAS